MDAVTIKRAKKSISLHFGEAFLPVSSFTFQKPLTLDQTQIQAVKLNVLSQHSSIFALVLSKDVFFSLVAFSFSSFFGAKQKHRSIASSVEMVTKPFRAWNFSLVLA